MLMGMSLMRGSGFLFFLPCVYSYWGGMDICAVDAQQEEIPDSEIRDVLQKVSCSFN